MVLVEVCLAGRRIGSEATLHRRNHRKPISADLNLFPIAELSRTKHHDLRRGATLQSPQPQRPCGSAV